MTKLTPPPVPNTLISFPNPHTILITLNRPKALNSVQRPMHLALSRLFTWYDAQLSLRCAVITGTGRAFCAGADLKEWNDNTASDGDANSDSAAERTKTMEQGFGGLSNRRGKKPVIAAVNGLCLGGGMEMVLNVDLIIASETAKFGLPEVKRGVVAIAGALPRLIRTVGRQRASEIALLGRMYTASQMADWGIVNMVVPADKSVLDEALKWAAEMAENSPDSIIVTREGLMGGWDAEDPVTSTNRVDEGIYKGLVEGENIKEGVQSFVEKREPKWRDSKL